MQRQVLDPLPARHAHDPAYQVAYVKLRNLSGRDIGTGARAHAALRPPCPCFAAAHARVPGDVASSVATIDVNPCQCSLGTCLAGHVRVKMGKPGGTGGAMIRRDSVDPLANFSVVLVLGVQEAI
jgi:hypothetical protein